ncbi:MAG: metalloprotease PmbA [Pseudomonadota bacterium]
MSKPAATAAADVTRLSLTRAELEGLVGDILAEASRHGATQAEAAVSVDAGLSVTVRMGEVETLEYQRDRGLGVTVYVGKAKGAASTADLDPAAVRATVEKACTIARYTAEDACAGLADAGRMATDVPDFDLDHGWDLSPEEGIEIATRCEAAARAVDARISNSEGGTVNTHRGLHVYGNSHGFVAGYQATSHSISCSMIAQDEAGMQRDYWYTTARDPAAMDTPEAVGERAARRTVRRLGSRKIKTRKAPVVYPAELARGLIGHFLAAIRGSSQYRQSSFLLDAVGSQVFPDGFQISERPHIPKALGSTAFDSEGVATRNRELVADGVLQGYILGSYSARRLGLETTGNAGGIHNLIVAPGMLDREQLLAEMGTGFLVTELMGQGINPVTGDYSRGAAGYWVENGTVQFPVHEVTVAGNLKDMFRTLRAVGSDVDTRSKVRCGSLLLDEMTIAGA